MKFNEALATLERLGADPKFPKAAQARRAAAAAKAKPAMTAAELADLSVRVSALEEDDEERKKTPVGSIADARKKLEAVERDDDATDEEKAAAKRALEALDAAEKATVARAVKARLSPAQRELLARCEEKPMTSRATSHGNTFSMPERIPSQQEAAARVAEINRELGETGR